jgi:glycosyltransferase involved in cell wall biosynthesis
MSRQEPITSSIIISVYSDSAALDIILNALQFQGRKDFEIIISEDGRNEQISKVSEKWKSVFKTILHLTQADDGFRKNLALNRAIIASNTDHLIFIDGDCIPHPLFIEAHQTHRGEGCASAGRRVELGPDVSTRIRTGKLPLKKLFKLPSYLLLLPQMISDKTGHIAQGFPSRFLHALTSTRHIRILGCNFSCSKQDLYKINGFNEDFIAAGWGEDSDIEWRLRHINVTVYNVKFLAIQYHLYHKRWYTLDDDNRKIFEESKQNNIYYCKRGLSQHSARDIKAPDS